MADSDLEYRIDPKLKEWATDTQKRYIDAVNQYGSLTKAAKMLGVVRSTVTRSIEFATRRAAIQGYSPDHDMVHTTPSPFVTKGVSTYYDAEGTPRQQWVKTRLDAGLQEEAIRAAVAALADDVPRLDPIAAPLAANSDLCNLFVFSDYHLGMLAHRAQGDPNGEWDVPIAEALLKSAFEHLVAAAPSATDAVIDIQGDFFHSDALEHVTPLHKHVLDQDGTYARMVRAGVRVLRRLCDIALMKHLTVRVILLEGNHDMASSVWLRELFAALYENEPRLTVDRTELPYVAHQVGKVMICFHHGHLKKNDHLPLLFAAQFPVMWGSTTKRYAHVGHRHHEEIKEHAGMKVIQHPTLSARDAHAQRGGWISERQASVTTYHREFGKVGENIVTPEMLAA